MTTFEVMHQIRYEVLYNSNKYDINPDFYTIVMLFIFFMEVII
jgi:hypothetical protein